MKKLALFVSSLCNTDGTVRVTALLANEFIKHYDCSIVTLYKDKDIYFKIDKKINIINIYNKRVRLKEIIFKSISKYIDIIENNKIDNIFIIGKNNGIMSLIAAYLLKRKVIFCEHNSILNYKFYNENLAKRFYRKIFQTLIIKLSYRIIVLTAREKKIFLNLYNIRNNKILVIPNYVDKQIIDKNLIYNIESRKIMTVGRIDYQKGYEYLVEVAKKIFEKHPDWQWDIYGDGDKNYKNQIIDLIKQNNLEKNVILQGNHSDIYDLYQNYSFYVMTSRYEGLPMVLLEAKAKKLPLISFDINSGPSDIIRDDIDGFLVNPFDCKAMADKICELIENPNLRQKLSDKAHGNLDKFSKEKVINQWCNLIEEI